MTHRAPRRIAIFAAVLVACACTTAATAPEATAAVTTQTPVMGPNLLNAGQLARWYMRHHGSIAPNIPGTGNNVTSLAQIFLDQGRAEGVRGDIAFVQSMLETGWLGFQGSQIPPDANNFAGIFAFDGRESLPNCIHGDSSPSRCMGTPQHGALVQMQLLRSYADPSAKTLSDRFISAPSDRAGMAPLWEYFGGHNCPCGKLIWASADDYGLIIIRMYSQALAESAAACADCTGFYDPSNQSWHLRDDLSPGPSNYVFVRGGTNVVPLTGDWNGDGRAGAGYYDRATHTFQLSNALSGGVSNYTFTFGYAGVVPVVGNWDGVGGDSVGVYDPATATFKLRDALSAGSANHVITYGYSGVIPVVGNWDGRGSDGIGVFDVAHSTFKLRDSLSAGFANYVFAYGYSGVKPLAGNWDGRGGDGIGVYDPSSNAFKLRDAPAPGAANHVFVRGAPGVLPVIGNWDGK